MELGDGKLRRGAARCGRRAWGRGILRFAAERARAGSGAWSEVRGGLGSTLSGARGEAEPGRGRRRGARRVERGGAATAML